ncbi:hypothetical protein TNIN_85491 [Trichonephila inaurata madagascariensis]|uniref:Uncharacterized protein n=1 Tax=Trichonephila inaurata madagascariensis TaxID=2747483 RepID=A0A8X7C9F6_9ARAC|nr:hypothetical protein TNIN_85491 [Trichonephila inaurata madagascariensis]
MIGLGFQTSQVLNGVKQDSYRPTDTKKPFIKSFQSSTAQCIERDKIPKILYFLYYRTKNPSISLGTNHISLLPVCNGYDYSLLPPCVDVKEQGKTLEPLRVPVLFQTTKKGLMLKEKTYNLLFKDVFEEVEGGNISSDRNKQLMVVNTVGINLATVLNIY